MAFVERQRRPRALQPQPGQPGGHGPALHRLPHRLADTLKTNRRCGVAQQELPRSRRHTKADHTGFALRYNAAEVVALNPCEEVVGRLVSEPSVQAHRVAFMVLCTALLDG